MNDYIPFPTDALGDRLAGLVHDYAAAFAVDDSFLALPMLAVAGSAIGNSRRLTITRTWAATPTLWAGIVGRSGTCKTPPLQAIMAPAVDLEHAEIDRHNAAAAGGDDPGPPPRWIVSDCTVEALADRLRHSPRGLLLSVDELAAWVRALGQYKQGGGSDLQAWLALHDAQTLTVDRKTGDVKQLRVRNATCAVVGGIQPGVLADVFMNAQGIDSGLTARLLLAWPPERSRRWSDMQELPQETAAAWRALLTRLRGLDFQALATAKHKPLAIKLSDGARATWASLYDDLHGKLDDADDDHERAVWSKASGQAARLALVLHCVAGEAGGCSADTVERAGRLARWFAGEHVRIYRVLSRSGPERRASDLAAWIHEKAGGKITVRELQRRRGSKFPRACDARLALDGLVEYGLAAAVTAAQDTGPASTTYRIVDNPSEPVGTTSDGF
jgi:hypothetical protein